MLDIVERVVNEEAQLGYDAQLVAHACSQLVAYGLFTGVDVLHYLIALVGREDAEISCADAEVGRHATLGHAHHHAVHHSCLRLEDEAKLLLQQSRYSVLSCFLHICYCFIIVFLKEILAPPPL